MPNWCNDIKHQPARSKALFLKKFSLSFTPGYHPGRPLLALQSCGFLFDCQNLFSLFVFGFAPFVRRPFYWWQSGVSPSLAHLANSGVAYVVPENRIFVIFNFPVFVVPFAPPTSGTHWKSRFRKSSFIKVSYHVFSVIPTELAWYVFKFVLLHVFIPG